MKLTGVQIALMVIGGGLLVYVIWDFMNQGAIASSPAASALPGFAPNNIPGSSNTMSPGSTANSTINNVLSGAAPAAAPAASFLTAPPLPMNQYTLYRNGAVVPLDSITQQNLTNYLKSGFNANSAGTMSNYNNLLALGTWQPALPAPIAGLI